MACRCRPLTSGATPAPLRSRETARDRPAVVVVVAVPRDPPPWPPRFDRGTPWRLATTATRTTASTILVLLALAPIPEPSDEETSHDTDQAANIRTYGPLPARVGVGGRYAQGGEIAVLQVKERTGDENQNTRHLKGDRNSAATVARLVVWCHVVALAHDTNGASSSPDSTPLCDPRPGSYRRVSPVIPPATIGCAPRPTSIPRDARILVSPGECVLPSRR